LPDRRGIGPLHGDRFSHADRTIFATLSKQASMTQAAFMLQVAAVGAVAAVLLLRYAWSRPRRSVPLNGAAWTLLVIALSLGAGAAGAWGMAVTSVVATTVALLCLAQAAITAPPGKSRSASNRRANMLPQGDEPKRIGRRIVTFLIAVPGAFIATLIISVASRGLTGPLGWAEADANVLPLFLAPVVWSILVTLLLIWPRRRTQYMLLAVPSIIGGLILALTGGLS